MKNFLKNLIKTPNDNGKVLVIPDVHGERFWLEAKKRLDNGEDVHCIFLGDFADSYENILTNVEPDYPELVNQKFKEILEDKTMNPYSKDTQLINLKRMVEVWNLSQIIEFKIKYPDKVTLLLGNHDAHYIFPGLLDGSRKAGGEARNAIKALFDNNLELFDIVKQVGDVVFSHAMITKKWMELNKVKDLDDINKRFHEKDGDLFRWNGSGWDVYGESQAQSPLWSRTNNLEFCPYKKIVNGHTHLGVHRVLKKTGHEAWFIDKHIKNKHYLEMTFENNKLKDWKCVGDTLEDDISDI